MTDIAGIAGNAVAVYQQALSTVSNNIANVSTEGYSRQDVSLSALPVTKSGNVFLGSGVSMDRVKRQYDAFVESNLRNTTSDLATQAPLVDYANRVVDVLGGATMGLNTALDSFFASARTLSSDPSSTVLRGSFIRDSQGVADRFGQLSAQLDLVQDQTQHELDNSVEQINGLTAQIAKVNAQLTKQRTEEAQPPDLLDQRDLLLKQLSEFAHINTKLSTNGTVTVSVGPSITSCLLVDGQKSFRIQANYNAAAPEKVALVLDPYGNASSITGITSGSLAGIMSFRETVLGGSRSALDTLAKTLANEANTISQQGIDGYGDPGQALFKFDPTSSTAAGGIRVAFEDPMRVATGAQFRVTQGANNVSGANPSVAFDELPPPPLDQATKVIAKQPSGPAPLQTALNNNDNPSAAKTFNVSASVPFAGVATIQNGMQDVAIYLDSMQKGQQLQVMTRDGRQIIGSSLADTPLGAALVSPGNGLANGATYSDQYLYQPQAAVAVGQPLQVSVANAFTVTSSNNKFTVGIDGIQGSFTLAEQEYTADSFTKALEDGINTIAMRDDTAPLGVLGVKASYDGATNSLIFRTNRIGSPASISVTANGPWGLQETTQAQGNDGAKYKGMTVFYGAQAQAQQQPIYDSNDKISGYTNYPAALQGTSISPLTLSNLPSPKIGGSLLATSNGASGKNPLRYDFSALKLEGDPTLQINGKGIDLSTIKQVDPAAPSYHHDVLQRVADSINTSDSNVVASLDGNDQLIITTAGLSAGTFTLNGQKLGPLQYPVDGAELQATSIAQWVNQVSNKTGVIAHASNEIQIDAAQIKYGMPLYFKVDDSWLRVETGLARSPSELAMAINSTKLFEATVNRDGQLIINNAQGREGYDITVAATPSDSASQASVTALGVGAKTFKGKLSMVQPVAEPVRLAISAITNGDLGNPLYINGTKIDIPAPANYSMATESIGRDGAMKLAANINAKAGVTNVTARVSDDGQLILGSTAVGADAAITVTGDPYINPQGKEDFGRNTLQGAQENLNGSVRVDGTLSANLRPLQLGFGTGTPFELASLGFRTGAFISGPVKDDMLVFVTGAGSAAVSASYFGKPVDAKQDLRAQTLTVEFHQDSKYPGQLYYKIFSNDPKVTPSVRTEVAERTFDETKLSSGVSYQGLSILFNAAPKPGDIFTIDGNQDSLGDNQNMLKMASLETKAVVGGKTLSNAYIDQINSMGNIARQATISQSALTVVHQQAVASRDQISGVSLDKEAADLIRYQQAYQASAKVLQIASQLFDSVLRVQ